MIGFCSFCCSSLSLLSNNIDFSAENRVARHDLSVTVKHVLISSGSDGDDSCKSSAIVVSPMADKLSSSSFSSSLSAVSIRYDNINLVRRR